MILAKIDVKKYQPTKESVVLLDTNILINLFYPIMASSYMDAYEKLYAELLKKKSKLLLPAIQVSEFINRCIRFQYNLYKENNNLGSSYDFKKEYRNTDDYRNYMNTILDIVKDDILPLFNIVNDNFSTMEQEKIYVYGFSYDFNDALLVQIAKSNHAAIVTHDSDFANYDKKIDYISSNSKLLMFS